MTPQKKISKQTIGTLANHIAEPIKGNVDEDTYDRVVENIAFAFDQAQTKYIPDPVMVDGITDAAMGLLTELFRDDISPDDFAILRGRFHRAFTGYTASDRN
jgi:hypothetical protein